MKNLLLLAALALATTEANAAASQTPGATKQERKATRKANRQAKSPQVYKGTVAEQRRLLTDADGAEKDQDTNDKAPKSSKKKSKE